MLSRAQHCQGAQHPGRSSPLPCFAPQPLQVSSSSHSPNLPTHPAVLQSLSGFFPVVESLSTKTFCFLQNSYSCFLIFFSPIANPFSHESPQISAPGHWGSPSLAISAGFSSLRLVKVRCGSFSAPTGNEPKSFCCGNAGLVAQPCALGQHPPATAPALPTPASRGRASEEQRSVQPLNSLFPPRIRRMRSHVCSSGLCRDPRALFTVLCSRSQP